LLLRHFLSITQYPSSTQPRRPKRASHEMRNPALEDPPMYRRRPVCRRFSARAFRPRIEYLEGRTLPSASAAMVMPFLQITADGKSGGPPSSALTPAQFRNAYDLGAIRFSSGSSSSVSGDGSGQTVAIVDAFDDPTIASDLAAFDARFGLSAPGSFLKIDQRGKQITGSPNINSDAAWAMEISLDVEWAHSVAPRAGIVLVEADSSAWSDINAAIHTAANYPGVSVVSMSFGISENAFNPVAAGYDTAFAQPSGHNPVSFVAAAGDDGALGYGTAPSWPASSPYVLAVGGTTLNLTSGSQYLSETAWAGTTAGNSLYEAQPTYQLGVQNSGHRQVPDVSLDADPKTGVAVLSTSSHGSGSGWFQVGGTSLAAPAWAAFLAIADQGRALNNLPTLGQAQADVYTVSRSSFNTVRSAFNPTAVVTKSLDPQTGLGTIRGNVLANALANVVETTNVRVPHTTTVVVRTGTSANPLLLVVFNAPAVPLPQAVVNLSASVPIPATFVQIAPNAGADVPSTPSLPPPTPILLAHSTVDLAPPADTPPPAATPAIIDAEPDDLPDLVPEKDNTVPAINGPLQARDACFVTSPGVQVTSSAGQDAAAPAAETVTVQAWHLAGVAAMFTGAYTRAEREDEKRKNRPGTR
jgi:hypothetical protein